MKVSAFPYFFLSFLIVLADQTSKWAVDNFILQPHAGEGSIKILPFFNITLVWNRGISFGLFNQESTLGAWLLIVLALLICAVFAYWLGRGVSRVQAVGIALVIGGALGNVIDRLRFGAVMDFLDFHVAGWHWPAFNLADSCICIGVGILLFHSLFLDRKDEKS